MRINGAFIDAGPQDWQILQRHDGFASVELAGVWNVPAEFDVPVQCVQVRVVDENTNRAVINWESCETTFADDRKSGSWKYTLKNIPEGGLYRLETKVFSGDYVWGVRGDMRHHIGVGDIYCIIGQSNATGYGRDHVTDAPDMLVHLLRARGEWDIATHPFNDSTDTIFPDNREGSNPGSCPYLSFGKTLKNALHVPVGLIPAAQGGSPICDWLPSQNGYLYRNMQQYLNAIGNDFAGFLWYQGCTDAQENRHPENYLKDFSELVDTLRADYGHKPILTTQLNKVTTDYRTPNSPYPRQSFGMVRGAQRDAAHQIPDVYVVPSYDLPMSDEIHNCGASNLVIGERLAEVALHAIYHLPGHENCFAPDVASVEKTAENQTTVTFDHCEHLVVLTVPTVMMPFACEDEQGMMFPTKMEKCSENSMTVTWERPLAGAARVSLAAEEMAEQRVIFDQRSYLPPLAFYRENVK